MLIIKNDLVNEGWKSCLKKLVVDGVNRDDKKFYRDELVIIEIKKPSVQQIPEIFPMNQRDIDIINEYIVSGEREDEVVHEWTKLYYHRIFDGPNSQIKFVLEELKEEITSGKCQISMWDKNVDQTAKISPCTQIIWCRKRDNLLEMHVHAHSSDAYKKLLMNMQEFVSLQLYIATNLKLRVGKYYHIIDSCHIYESDKFKIEEILKSL